MRNFYKIEGGAKFDPLAPNVYLHHMKHEELLDEVMERCAAMKTLSAARNITRLFDEAIRSTGLTITQFTLLIAIGKARPTSISQIGKYLSLDRSSVTRNLKPLEAAGLVTRGPEGEKRMRQVLLTQTGKAKLKKAYPLWQRAQGAVEAALTDSSYAATMRGMTKLRNIGRTDQR